VHHHGTCGYSATIYSSHARTPHICRIAHLRVYPHGSNSRPAVGQIIVRGAVDQYGNPQPSWDAGYIAIIASVNYATYAITTFEQNVSWSSRTSTDTHLTYSTATGDGSTRYTINNDRSGPDRIYGWLAV
jgi:hypothetical protein